MVREGRSRSGDGPSGVGAGKAPAGHGLLSCPAMRRESGTKLAGKDIATNYIPYHGHTKPLKPPFYRIPSASICPLPSADRAYAAILHENTPPFILKLALLLGANRCGKSAIFEVVGKLRDFVRGDAKGDELFSTGDITHWSTKIVQYSELKIAILGEVGLYRLVIEHNLERRFA